MPNLANRLTVYACHDLADNAPKSYSALKHWEQQCGFWLAELSACALTPDQPQFMAGLLACALVREHKDFSLPQACQLLNDHMTLHMMARQS